MPNRLSLENSPYLLDHAENPVQWLAWGAEAWDRARREDKPIFLSIGYSACHWCHVMAHESFEDPNVAAALNEHFVPIKVDREERPDVDQLYMEAVQHMTGRGGWPLSVFLTPELEAFYGGTYWPPRARGGMPGFLDVLRAVADAWQNRRAQAVEQARQLTAILGESGLVRTDGARDLDAGLLAGAEEALERAFDPRHGGFGHAPKFPQAMALRLVLRRWRRTGRAELLRIVTVTLERMAAGGIYDQLGGGFHRYSTDEAWLVPHFEKMLYDNALLADCYLEAFQATGNSEYARVVRETLDYVLAEMTDAQGGFYAAQDADSEGHEGLYYLWTPDEVRAVLGADAARAFCAYYDVSQPGNFEGRNILNRPKTLQQVAAMLGRPPEAVEEELAASRRQLLEIRRRRVPPARDDKVLADWNGLMIEAMARAGAVLGEPRYTQAAVRAARFILDTMRSGEGRLLRAWRGGRAAIDAMLDDYAALANALVSLYEATFEETWIDEACGLADAILDGFSDGQGGFYIARGGDPSLIVRKHSTTDSSAPAGAALATTALLRLGRLTGREGYRTAAEASLRAASDLMRQWPSAMGQMLLALDLFVGPGPQIVILGAPDAAADAEVLAALRRRYLPGASVAYRASASPTRSPTLDRAFEGKSPLPPGPTVFVCEDFACQAPVSGREAAIQAWERLEGTVHCGVRG